MECRGGRITWKSRKVSWRMLVEWVPLVGANERETGGCQHVLIIGCGQLMDEGADVQEFEPVTVPLLPVIVTQSHPTPSWVPSSSPRSSYSSRIVSESPCAAVLLPEATAGALVISILVSNPSGSL